MLFAASVGRPGLLAIVTGGLLFALALLVTRLRAGGAAAGEQRSNASRAGIAVQMAGFASVGFGPVRAGLPPWSAASLAETAIVLVLMAASLGLFLAATRAMGANWSLAARVREAHELVTHGVFARMRNPIYVAMGLSLGAMVVALGHHLQAVIGVPLFALGTWIRVAEEERLLRRHFGEAYDAYAARVPRFVPGLA